MGETKDLNENRDSIEIETIKNRIAIDSIIELLIEKGIFIKQEYESKFDQLFEKNANK